MSDSDQDGVPEHVSDNIEAVLEMRAKSERRLRRDQRAVEALTLLIGQPRSLYVLLIGIIVWTSYNHARTSFDPPPFFWLQGIISLYAAIMTTIVLTTQNRQSKEAGQHSHLELQVNLLAEQRTAKIIALLEELRRDLPNVRNRVDPVAEALQQAVPPTAVNSAIDHTMHPGEHDSGAARDALPSHGH